MFMQHLCIIIILYKRERCAASDPWGLVVCAHVHPNISFLFNLSSFSSKYILVNHFFFLHLFLQNSYSDNRCRGDLVFYFMRRCACTRATPKPKYIQYFLRLSLCFFPYVPSFFTLLRYLVPLYPHLSNFLSSFYNHSDFRISKSRSLLRRLVFRQPPFSFFVISIFFVL